jgi:hypothetical protein
LPNVFNISQIMDITTYHEIMSRLPVQRRLDFRCMHELVQGKIYRYILAIYASMLARMQRP